MSAVYETLKLLTPFDIDVAKHRVGSYGDGGYILADCLSSDQSVLSYGLGWNLTFDHAMADRGHKIFMFDHTIKQLPIRHPNFTFAREGVAPRNDEASALYTIEHHIDRLNIKGRMILKMDVEGAEWDVLGTIPHTVLERFDQIVVKVNCLTRLVDTDFRSRAVAALTRLNEEFTLFHIHASNHAPITSVEGLPVCDVMELSYIRTSLVNRRPSETCYPTPLDMANKFDRPDHVLAFFPFVPDLGSADRFKLCATQVVEQKRSSEEQIRICFEQAVARHQAGDFAQAAIFYRKTLAVDPDNLASLSNLSMLVDVDEAEILLTNALALFPGYVNALVNLARTYLLMRQPDQVAEVVQRILAIDPANELGLAFLKEADAATSSAVRSKSSSRAIVALVRGYPDVSGYQTLLARNRAIYDCINAKRADHYPIVIFHEGNISEEHQAYIRSHEQNAFLSFVNVSEHFKFTAGVRREDMLEGWPDGYRFMCRFNSRAIFDLTRQFDMIMRIDEDCMLEDVLSDPFDQLVANGQVFATVSYIDESHQLTMMTLPGAINAVLDQLGLPGIGSVRHKAAYTNVYVTETAFWHRADVLAFTSRIVENVDFLRLRWGDAPVIGYALGLFAENRVGLLPIQYFHGSHNLRLTGQDGDASELAQESTLPPTTRKLAVG